MGEQVLTSAPEEATPGQKSRFPYSADYVRARQAEHIRWRGPTSAPSPNSLPCTQLMHTQPAPRQTINCRNADTQSSTCAK